MFALLLSLFLTAPPGLPASHVQTDIPKGQVIEKVVCAGNPTQSYALYLPSNYDATRKWPILYAFDPGARGKIPVERFKEAAEKFGWIIVGSNNSRNSTLQSSIESWNAMTRDTTERFSIDDARAYAAGFSGGARVAILFATQCNDCLAGVIASGAGFPGGIEPATTMHFPLFAAAGTEDFNFAEVKSLEESLARANMTYQIETFAARHEWLPSSVAIDAVGWMELLAMKSGRRERDAQFIESWMNTKLKQAREFEGARKGYEAYQIYRELSSALKGLRDVAAFENKLSQLRESREVRDAIRDEQQQIKKQRELEGQLAGLVAATGRMKLQADAAGAATNDRTGDEPIDSEARLDALLVELNKQAKGKQDTATRRIARRVLEGQYVALFERGYGLLQNQKRYDEATRVFLLATKVAPDRPNAFYYLASAYGAKGDKKKSLKALQTAVDKGFSDAAALAGNKAFDSMRDDPQFQTIISALKTRP